MVEADILSDESLEFIGRDFTQTFESGNLSIFAEVLDGFDAFLVGIAITGLFLVAYAEQWCLQNVDVSFLDEVGKELQQEGKREQTYVHTIVIGIAPALKLAYARYHGGGIGVMATPMTLREEKFEALMHRYDQSCRVYKIPAPGLVELVERGQADSPEAESLLRELFAPYQGKLDEVVLGCTHYPFAAKAISRALGSGGALLDGGDGTARETRRRLAEAGLLENGTGEVILTNSLPDESILELSRKLLDEK